MDYMAGSVSEIRQFYFINDKSATSWSDPTTTEGQMRHVRIETERVQYVLQGRLEGD